MFAKFPAMYQYLPLSGACLTQDLLNEVPSIKLLSLITYTNSEGEKARFELITEIQTYCEDIGIQLGINVEGPRAESKGLADFCRRIFNTWRDRFKEATWEKLLKVLDDLQLGGIANKLKIALKSRILN